MSDAYLIDSTFDQTSGVHARRQIFDRFGLSGNGKKREKGRGKGKETYVHNVGSDVAIFHMSRERLTALKILSVCLFLDYVANFDHAHMYHTYNALLHVS